MKNRLILRSVRQIYALPWVFFCKEKDKQNNAMSTQSLCSNASTSFFVNDVSSFLGITYAALSSTQRQNGIPVGVMSKIWL